MTKQTKKLPEKKVKPADQIAKLEMNNAILTQALYMQYDDMDELQNLLASVIDSMEMENASIYRARYALKAIRSLLIHQQYSTMDCAGLEY
jgi:hypothetical protein